MIAAIPCGGCRSASGEGPLCPNQDSIGSDYDGGFAELMLVPAKVIEVGGVRGLTDGRGADVVITAAASGTAQEQAVRMAASRGRISLSVGCPGRSR